MRGTRSPIQETRGQETDKLGIKKPFPKFLRVAVANEGWSTASTEMDVVNLGSLSRLMGAWDSSIKFFFVVRLSHNNTVSNVQRDSRRISHQSEMCIQCDNELITRFENGNQLNVTGSRVQYIIR